MATGFYTSDQAWAPPDFHQHTAICNLCGHTINFPMGSIIPDCRRCGHSLKPRAGVLLSTGIYECRNCLWMQPKTTGDLDECNTCNSQNLKLKSPDFYPFTKSWGEKPAPKRDLKKLIAYYYNKRK